MFLVLKRAIWEDRHPATVVEKTKQQLGTRAKGQKAVEAGAAFQLRESQVAYPADFGPEKNDIAAENTYFGDVL